MYTDRSWSVLRTIVNFLPSERPKKNARAPYFFLFGRNVVLEFELSHGVASGSSSQIVRLMLFPQISEEVHEVGWRYRSVHALSQDTHRYTGRLWNRKVVSRENSFQQGATLVGRDSDEQRKGQQGVGVEGFTGESSEGSDYESVENVLADADNYRLDHRQDGV